MLVCYIPQFFLHSIPLSELTWWNGRILTKLRGVWYYLKWKTLASDYIWCCKSSHLSRWIFEVSLTVASDRKHNLLYVSGDLGHFNWMEVVLLYCYGCWVWHWWSLHGVCLQNEYFQMLALSISGWQYISWAHEICSSDNEERALTVASMNDMAAVVQAWLPLIVWQQIDAPGYRKGYITLVVMAVLLVITTFTIRELEFRENQGM